MMKLEVYPCMDSFVGKFVLAEETKGKRSHEMRGTTQTVVILDRSGSMNDEVGRITTKLLPAALRKLGYEEDDRIVFITFDSRGECVEKSVADLARHNIDCRGCTEMASGLNELHNYFPKLKPDAPLRILIISDGEVSDKDAVLTLSDKLAAMFISAGFAVNAQGYRWFTSDCQPDTSALACVLKFNTIGAVILQDIDARKADPELVTALALPFESDGLDQFKMLQTESSKKIFLDYPWKDANSSEILVIPGENVFWLSEKPEDNDIVMHDRDQAEFGNTIIPVILCDRLDSENHVKVFAKKVTYFLDHLKLLKVNETADAKKEIQQIVSYFIQLEKVMEQDAAAKADAGIVGGMSETMKVNSKLDDLMKAIAKRERSFVNKMREIANDDKVSRLSAQQTADYLRKDLGNDRCTKGLAGRIGDDLDFTGVARQEVRAMYEHLKELEDVDDSTHATSFLDLETTLAGIRTTCSLLDLQTPSGETLLDSVDVGDILRLFNIVGLACDAPIGTYPDAMTWRVHKVFLGTFCSVSDVLMQSHVEGGLLVPRGYESEDCKISNVIPFIEDLRIVKFLRNYAPKLLEFSAGEGMRRILGAVNGTFQYTICNGLMQLINQLDRNRSSLYLRTFVSMVETFSSVAGGYFDHILPFLDDQEDAEKHNKLYYLDNNGITNLLYPILQILISTEKYLKAIKCTTVSPNNAKKLMPRILRGLYSHEVWQAVRRTYKYMENSDVVAKAALMDLLGIDLVKHKTHLTPLFEAEPADPQHYDQYHLNESALESHTKGFWYLDSMVLIPPFLAAAANKDIEGLQSIPVVSDAFMAQSYDISYDLVKFRFYNVVQALIFNTRALRVDDGASSTPEPSSNVTPAVPAAENNDADKKNDTTEDVKESEDVAIKTVEEKAAVPRPSMRVQDLKNEQSMEKFLKDFVRRQYCDQYLSDVAQKKKDETKVLKDMFVEKILASTSHDETMLLFRDGVTVHSSKWALLNSSTIGFLDLEKALLDVDRIVPRRLETLKLLLLGKDEAGVEVWNKGKALFCMSLKKYEDVFVKLDRMDLWDPIRLEHRALNVYEYNREKPNRHSHGKYRPSYWAMGFPTMEAIIAAVDNKEMDINDLAAYCKEHCKCCGVERLTKNRFSLVADMASTTL
jgi:hypothetical protein